MTINWDAPFPEVLRAWMKARGMTRPKAADVLGIEVQTLDRWLYVKGGRECPYPESFKRLMQLIVGEVRDGK